MTESIQEVIQRADQRRLAYELISEMLPAGWKYSVSSADVGLLFRECHAPPDSWHTL